MTSPRFALFGALISIGSLLAWDSLLRAGVEEFRRGDNNQDSNVDVSDPVSILGYLFLGGAMPNCFDAADGNDDGTVDIADPVWVLNFLFLGGPPPPLPGPSRCGHDPTVDDLDCLRYVACDSAGGCATNADCPPDAYCAKVESACDAAGTCLPRPEICLDVWIPVCGCDGQTYGNDCEAAAAGVSIAHRGECRPPESCTTNEDCPIGFYCAKEDGDCDGEGTCLPRPEICIDVWDPVCGCDGQTYGNDCEAAAAGVSIAHRGECRPPDSCTSNEDCPNGFYCAKEEGDCDGEGTCLPRPEICPLLWDPVCGCDGQTYGNDCSAAASGVNVAYRGECRPQEGCGTNADCPNGFYCAREDGQCDSDGVCRERPEICPDVWAPVCGCDGQTYGNACEAAAAGVNILHLGECGEQGCRTNEDCPADSFCKTAPGDCDGAGVCSPRPEICLDVWIPVCGCDGRTYGNECEAYAAGVSVRHRGECLQ